MQRGKSFNHQAAVSHGVFEGIHVGSRARDFHRQTRRNGFLFGISTGAQVREILRGTMSSYRTVPGVLFLPIRGTDVSSGYMSIDEGVVQSRGDRVAAA